MRRNKLARLLCYLVVLLSFHYVASAQSDNCVTNITPGALHFTSSGGSGSVTVDAISGCLWNVGCSGAAIKSFTPGFGTGSGIFGVTAVSNPGPKALTGACTVVWGNNGEFFFTVNISVDPPAVSSWWPAIQQLLE